MKIQYIQSYTALARKLNVLYCIILVPLLGCLVYCIVLVPGDDSIVLYCSHSSSSSGGGGGGSDSLLQTAFQMMEQVFSSQQQ